MNEQLSLFETDLFDDSNMHTHIDSIIKIYNPTPNIVNFCVKQMRVKNSEYEFYRRKKKTKLADYKGIPKKLECYNYDSIANILEIPFGMLHRLWGEIKKHPYETKFNVSKDFISIYNQPSPETLYDYQEMAVSKMIEAKFGVLVSPCGSGKTRMGIELIHRLGKPFLWLTHTKDLLTQTKKTFKYLYPNIDLGEYSGDKKEFGTDGTIAMVQSLSKLNPKDYFDKFDVIVCDECAHVVGSSKAVSSFGKILNTIPARYKFGLTATPSRSDDLIKTMYMYLGTNKQGEFAPTYQVPKENVKTYNATQIRIDLDTDLDNEERKKQFFLNNKKKNEQIDYTKLIQNLSNDHERTNKIIENILLSTLENRKQIVLCSRIEHIKEFEEKLKEKGIRAVSVSAKTKQKERDIILSKDGNTWDVLCATYSLLKEGTDIPALDTIHLATPLVSKSTIVQSIGRIERSCENKKTPIAYDYVDYKLKYLEVAFMRRKNSLEKRY